jgi:hypothetical protein
MMTTRSALPVCVGVLLFLAPPLNVPAASLSATPAAHSLQAAAGLPERIGVSLQAEVLTPPSNARRSQAVARSAHVWTNADLAHPSHRSVAPDPHLDQILAHLEANEYHWYPPVSDYDGPTWLSSPYRPAWQNAPSDWPTRRDRIERGGPFSIDEDLAPYGLPLFGCWYCAPSYGHVLRERQPRAAGGRGAAPRHFEHRGSRR